jgi:hypothetical protein
VIMIMSFGLGRLGLERLSLRLRVEMTHVVNSHLIPESCLEARSEAGAEVSAPLVLLWCLFCVVSFIMLPINYMSISPHFLTTSIPYFQGCHFFVR